MANFLSDFVSGIDLGGIADKVLLVLVLVFAIAIISGFMYLLLRWKSKKAKGTLRQIYWWEEISGRLTFSKIEDAEELTIPGTNLKLLYIKKSNTWLPRFTRGVSPIVFFVAITQHKEIVNFSLRSIDKELKEAGLDYDHTDMRWAAENLREFVKRNYKDKAVPWWREYMGVISTAAFILIMTFSFVIIIYFMRGIVQDIGSVASSIGEAANQLNSCTPAGSGVVLKG